MHSEQQEQDYYEEMAAHRDHIGQTMIALVAQLHNFAKHDVKEADSIAMDFIKRYFRPEVKKVEKETKDSWDLPF